MADRVNRRTVDLSSYPDLVVIYLGMRVNMLTGVKTLVQDTGFLRFAPVRPARGGMFSARERAGRSGEPSMTAPISEEQFYN